jgi:hypothetical protein
MRTIIDAFAAALADIDRRQRRLLDQISPEDIFWTPVDIKDSMVLLSVGGSVLRSAAMVEQVFLGLTRRLWDDPFEWTLPEKLSTKEAILGYLGEVAATCDSGLKFFASDADLSRKLPAPDELKTIAEVLIDAIAKAQNHLGRGEAVAKILTAGGRPKAMSD